MTGRHSPGYVWYTVVLLNVTPGQIRGQVVALYYIIISVAGPLIGPTRIGLLNDYIFGEDGIRFSVALVPLIAGLPVLLIAVGTRRRYIAECVRLKAGVAE